MVERLFLAVPRGCLQFVIVVFPDHTHLLFLHSVAYIRNSSASSVENMHNALIYSQTGIGSCPYTHAIFNCLFRSLARLYLSHSHNTVFL